MIIKMVAIGDKYFLDGASQCGLTRDKQIIEIKPYSEITKARETFSDKLRFRNMWRIDETGCEVDIDVSIIDRYFRPVSEMKNKNV